VNWEKRATPVAAETVFLAIATLCDSDAGEATDTTMILL
jgi:hypothetical protein